MPTSRVSGFARIALAAIRIVNGLTALVAPRVLTRKLGVGDDQNGQVRVASVRVPPVIHASDIASAV
jgi:hypothetical protein